MDVSQGEDCPSPGDPVGDHAIYKHLFLSLAYDIGPPAGEKIPVIRNLMIIKNHKRRNMSKKIADTSGIGPGMLIQSGKISRSRWRQAWA